MISITIDNLVKKFGQQTALNGISLRIEPGEIFFLLGPSGCGKTTLLRNIAGFYIPESGRILFGDDDVTNLPPHKRNTGMMFQSYALWPHLTVARNVAFGLEERKVPAAEIQKRVAEHFDVRLADMTSKRRPANIAFPRQIAMYLARELTKSSLAEIGEAFGGRDHGTVLHAHRQVRDKISKDDHTRQTVSFLDNQLQRH